MLLEKFIQRHSCEASVSNDEVVLNDYDYQAIKNGTKTHFMAMNEDLGKNQEGKVYNVVCRQMNGLNGLKIKITKVERMSVNDFLSKGLPDMKDMFYEMDENRKTLNSVVELIEFKLV